MAIFHGAWNYESITVDFNNHPRLKKEKTEELKNQGYSPAEIKEFFNSDSAKVELQLAYDPNRGIFAVEAEAVECCILYSPYTREQVEDEDIDNTDN